MEPPSLLAAPCRISAAAIVAWQGIISKGAGGTNQGLGVRHVSPTLAAFDPCVAGKREISVWVRVPRSFAFRLRRLQTKQPRTTGPALHVVSTLHVVTGQVRVRSIEGNACTHPRLPQERDALTLTRSIRPFEILEHTRLITNTSLFKSLDPDPVSIDAGRKIKMGMRSTSSQGCQKISRWHYNMGELVLLPLTLIRFSLGGLWLCFFFSCESLAFKLS
jgi:hypothetical protein